MRDVFEVYAESSRAVIPLGICVDGLVCGPALHGADPVTGQLEGDVDAQLAAALAKVRRLVEGAGGSPPDVTRIVALHDSTGFQSRFEAAWDAAFPGVTGPELVEASARQQPGRLVTLDCYARLPGSTNEPLQEIALSSPPHAGLRVATAGPLICGVATAVDPASGEMRGDDLMTQLYYALENMQALLEAAGSGLHEVARATVYMDVADLRVMNALWSALYPVEAERPPHKWIPTAGQMPSGQAAMVGFTAVRGAKERRAIEVEDIRHGDPMTMAAVTDGFVTSSRIIASRRETPADYAAAVFDNIETIMGVASGSIADLTQATAFIGRPEYAALVDEQLASRLPAGSKRPVVHFVEAGLGGQDAPRVEILGLVPPAR